MEQQQRQLIKKYIDLLLRRKNIVIAGLLLGLAGGLFMYLQKPKIYQCTSLIQYQRQRINPTAMSPDDVRTRTREVVSTVSQQVTSRTSLEKMIKDFDLYAGMRSVLPMEDVVETMRKDHIEISPDEGDIFRVSYEGRNPKKVLLVTNALAAQFIEENMRYREERASETSEYIQDELKMAKEGLDKKEAVMRDYKLQYFNEMPDQRQNNMTRLNALQEQYQNSQDSMHDLGRTSLLVQEQISLRKELFAQQLNGSDLSSVLLSGQQALGGMPQISQLRRELQSLQARYTDKHPEIRRLKKMIQELEGKQDGEIVPNNDASGENAQIAPEPRIPNDPQIEQLKRQLHDLEYDITRLKNEREDIKKQIEKFQAWAEAAPVREAEWAALTRDYDQLNQHYEALMAQSLQADSAYSLEKHQKGSQFKIIDSAHFPEKPFKPDFRKIMLMAVGIGVGIGGGLALGLELLDTSFKDPAELESYLGLPVVCAVPNVETEKEQGRKRVMQIVWSMLLIVSLAMLVACIVYFLKQGMIIL